MAGSNLIAVKAAIVAGLASLLAGDREIAVGWSHNGRTAAGTRKYVYLGSRVTGDQAPIAMAGGTRIMRSEEPQFSLAVEVRQPGEDETRAVEAEAMAIGARIEEWFAGNWLLGQDIPNLMKVLLAGFELEAFVDDDAAEATLTYTVQFTSSLR